MHAIQTGDDHCLCPFCRVPAPESDREYIERIMKRIDANDAESIYALGCYYRRGGMGFRQNKRKAMKLYLRAGKLGCMAAYCNVGYAYEIGECVESDMDKAKYYYELAAMGGHVKTRCNLGKIEMRAGNMKRAVKHFMISAGAGDDDSLKKIRECYLNGHATKDDFEKALRTHKESKDEMKSEQREAAAADRSRNCLLAL